ncbi:hypothetical protein MN116_001098 [Schistosoma mekongi]|uniref:non-specific serine/threonine protein kinase n=1 Tax=Schistosoma mekongi TaxID=38744 RepID=A0AAE1ZKY9_SCHME|nr:hypothetical protein MN116_001098 [Schistosoma mekongi]
MKDGSTNVFKSRYTVIKKLGKGASGKTYLVEDNCGSQQCTKILKALKCIKLDDNSQNTKEEYEKEAHLLSNLKHPYILCIHESFVDKNRFCIVSEYCEGGDLTSYLKQAKSKGERVSEKLIGKWLVQLLLATVYMHKSKILHRDLKTSNIFLKNGNIKVGDFGISRSMATTEELATTFIGTPYYMSPEVLKYEGYNNKSDIWSIGIILYELCTQRRAFTGTNIMRVMWQVINDPCPQLPEIYSKELQCVLELMLRKSPQERPSASELLQINVIRSYLRDLYKEIVFSMQNELPDENLNDENESYKLLSFEEFINSPDSILNEQQSAETFENLSIQSNEETEEIVMDSDDQYLTPREKIKLNKATESDRTIAVLRDLAEQLAHTRNSLSSTNETQSYTWQKGYPSLNHMWPTIQMSTEKILSELKKFYLEKVNGEYGVTDDLDEDLECVENLFWPSRPNLEKNNMVSGKGPGAEDESLGIFCLSNSLKRENEQIDDLKHCIGYTQMKHFYPPPGMTGPVYDCVPIGKLVKQDNSNDTNKIQENLFVRRQLTFPDILSNNYKQSANQLSNINNSKVKCTNVFSDDIQLMETYYSNYDDEILNYTKTRDSENLVESNEVKSIPQTELEDIESQDNVNSTVTLNDVLYCMKAALRHPEDSNTLVLDNEPNNIFSPEVKAKRIDALRKYCIEKLGVKLFHNAYNYLYQKRIIENNQSGELTILDGLKCYCSDVTTGFLLDHLIFLQNDTLKPTINIQSSKSIHQILNDDLQFCM